MQDGFRKEWVLQYLEGNTTKEFERAYMRGRSDVLAGRTPVDEEYFAFCIPKIVHYANQTEKIPVQEAMDEIMDEDEAGFASWGMDVKMPKDLLIYTCDTILDPREEESTYDGNFVMVGKICQTFEDWQEEQRVTM